MARSQNLSQDEKAKVVEMLQEGASTEAIAAALSHRRGVSVPTDEIEKAIAQLKKQVDADQLEDTFKDAPDLDAKPSGEEPKK